MSICGVSFPEINGFFIHTVVIQSQSEVDVGNGDTTISWATASTVKGLVCDMRGDELTAMQKIDPTIDSKIYLKKDSTVNNTNKLLINSKSYDVVFVKDPVSADEFLIVYGKSNGKA